MDTVQMIDADGAFCNEQIETAVGQRWKLGGRDLPDIGLDYSLLSVLGAQSTGKSTLLNVLFGTDFATMDATKGRYQTTRGMWLALASRPEFADKALLVLDSEGTDSKERWEDHEAFERRTALFSLALSNILLVNMWYQDIGRYEAMNYGLLRTVFEVHLSLFATQTDQPKTLLLFLIRDYHTTPKAVLETTIMTDINHLWSEIRKPEGEEEAAVTEYFDFEFETLPHKMLEPELFETAVDVLRNRFLNVDSDEYLLGSMYRKSVPADGFVAYSRNVWDTISNNKELDLPSQREMVALFRCDAIAEEAYVLFDEKITELRGSLDYSHGAVVSVDNALEETPQLRVDANNIVNDLGQQLQSAIQVTLNAYSTQADRYQESVATRKRDSLLERMIHEATALSYRQVENASSWLLACTAQWLDSARRIEGKWMESFSRKCDGVVKLCVSLLQTSCDMASSDMIKPDYDDILSSMKGDLDDIVTNAREDHMQTLITMSTNSLRSTLTSSIESSYAKLDDNPDDAITILWSSVRDGLARVVADIASDLLDKMTRHFNARTDELEAAESSLHIAAVAVTEDCAKESLKFLPIRLRQRFDFYFRYDRKTKLPRVWRKRDDPPTIYNTALEEAAVLVDAYSAVRLDPQQDSDGGGLPVMSESEVKAVTVKLRSDTESSYLEAVHAVESYRGAEGLPIWVFLLLLILGFNEMVYVLTSPLLLLVVAMIGGGLYVVQILGIGGGKGIGLRISPFNRSRANSRYNTRSIT